MIETSQQDRSTLISVILVVVVGVILISAQIVNDLPGVSTPIERLELSARDLVFQIRGKSQPEVPIVIVAIDEAAFNYTGYRWPWPRSYLAEIVDVLNDAGASVIGLDVFLFDKDDEQGEDEALAKSLEDSKASVSVMHLSKVGSSETRSIPIEIYRSVLDRYGVTGIIFDDDAIVRSIQTYDYSAYDDRFYYNWAFEIASLYLGVEQPDISDTGEIFFNDKVIPSRDGRMLINFLGPVETFPYYSAHQVALGDYSLEEFKDKVVLIGATTVTMQDVYPTPFSSRNRTPGVEVVANAVNTIVSGNYLRTAPPIVNILFVVMTGFLAWGISQYRHPIVSIVFAGVLVLIYGVIWYFVTLKTHIYFSFISVVVMLFLGVLFPIMGRMVNQEIERRRIRNLFNRFISPDMVSQLINTRDLDSLNKRARLTILFSDIRGFTSLSERLSPEDVVSLLNPYLKVMTEVIHKYGGTVDKYEGDAIVAFFGQPLPYSDHALRAVRAACEMRGALNELRRLWHQEGRYRGQFDIGIGINTGEVFVGLLGSEERLNYTVIGDAANLASRLQDQTKEIGWPIIISDETNQDIMSEFHTEFAGSRLLKGKSEAVNLYKVLGPKDSLDCKNSDLDIQKTVRKNIT